MKKFLTFSFAIFSFLAFSQTPDISSTGNYTGDKILADQFFKSVLKDGNAHIEGTPYLRKDFHPANIAGNPEQIMMRYDRFNDRFEFLRNGNIMILPKINQYQSVEFKEFNDKIELIGNYYYFNVHEGKNIQTYRKVASKFHEYEPPKNGYVNVKPAKFINLPDSFYIRKDNIFSEFPKNKKKLIELFPDKKTEISKYLKKNSLKFTEKADVKRLSIFLDQL